MLPSTESVAAHADLCLDALLVFPFLVARTFDVMDARHRADEPAANEVIAIRLQADGCLSRIQKKEPEFVLVGEPLRASPKCAGGYR